MIVFRILVFGILLTHELSRPEPVRPRATYDPDTLGTRRLPTELRLYRHPREISDERVREILGLPQ